LPFSPVARGRWLHGVDGVLCRRELICAMVVGFNGSGAPLIREVHGGISSSAACDGGATSSLRACLLCEPARVPSRGGALGAALQATSSSGGRGMHGLASFFLGGVRPSEELVVGAFGGGRGRSAGGHQRCRMDVTSWCSAAVLG
jgi:hypothetical protein